MRPDLDAIRAQIAAANPGAQQIATELGVPVLLDYIRELEDVLRNVTACGPHPPRGIAVDDDGCAVCRAHHAALEVLESAAGVLSLPPQKETA